MLRREDCYQSWRYPKISPCPEKWDTRKGKVFQGQVLGMIQEQQMSKWRKVRISTYWVNLDIKKSLIDMGWVCWLKFIILATREVVFRNMVVPGLPRQKVHETPISTVAGYCGLRLSSSYMEKHK
jgi:hypothetical protein